MIPVIIVLGLLAHREWAGDRDADRPLGVPAQEYRVADLRRLRAPDRSHDPRHWVRVAGAVERRSRIVEVDALKAGGKPVRVALPPDLTVGDHVDGGLLHLADGY